MSLGLSRFRIDGLHGRFDIDIPIRDDKLVLVGVNGLGKTTVVNILYFLITEQWSRLAEYEFATVGLQLRGTYFEVPRADLDAIDLGRGQVEATLRSASLTRIVPLRYAQRLATHPLFLQLVQTSDIASTSAVSRLARDVEMPATVLLRLLREFPKAIREDLFSYPASVRSLLSAIRDAGDYQVLFLPTYRRIEQDLKAIFPELEERQIRDIASRSGPSGLASERGHVELVQFGMQDVEGRISQELETIRESARSQLSNLTASYLRDVIRDVATSFDRETINALDAETVRAVLSRVEENTLDLNDKRELQKAIERIREQTTSISERDKYLAHFFSKLLEIHTSLSASEGRIRELAEVCNKYLEGKRLRYNDIDYTAAIVDRDDATISWKSLSSGEKQVASLFTHLLLSKEREQLVLIDEPELSLSVPWQKALLPDIVRSGKCSLLIAVTHSPFIYANELDANAVDLAGCIRPTLLSD